MSRCPSQGVSSWTLTFTNEQKAKERIAEIDAMFEAATGWGSWMVGCANEREALADRFGLPQKYQARTADGKPTD